MTLFSPQRSILVDGTNYICIIKPRNSKNNSAIILRNSPISLTNQWAHTGHVTASVKDSLNSLFKRLNVVIMTWTANITPPKVPDQATSVSPDCDIAVKTWPFQAHPANVQRVFASVETISNYPPTCMSC